MSWQAWFVKGNLGCRGFAPLAQKSQVLGCEASLSLEKRGERSHHLSSPWRLLRLTNVCWCLLHWVLFYGFSPGKKVRKQKCEPEGHLSPSISNPVFRSSFEGTLWGSFCDENDHCPSRWKLVHKMLIAMSEGVFFLFMFFFFSSLFWFYSFSSWMPSSAVSCLLCQGFTAIHRVLQVPLGL